MPAHATFPGTNGKIAFDVASEGSFQIHTINPDGSGRAAVTDGLDPAWSPDGRKLAISRGLQGLYTINADGTGASPVWSGGHFVEGIGWSPNGEKLAFVANGFCFGDVCQPDVLYVVRANGTGATPIAGQTDGLTEIRDPGWSPDGTRIVFSDEISFEIYSIRPDGTALTQLTFSDGSSSHASWSPDGRILFDYAVPGQPCLRTMDADGHGQTALAEDCTESPAAVSPDGSMIAFELHPCFSVGCNPDLFSMRSDGTGKTNLTNTPTVFEEHPDWQPVPGPRRSDYKNASSFCKAERDFFGVTAFATRYGTTGNGANAFGKCVSRN